MEHVSNPNIMHSIRNMGKHKIFWFVLPLAITNHTFGISTLSQNKTSTEMSNESEAKLCSFLAFADKGAATIGMSAHRLLSSEIHHNLLSWICIVSG
jgi:hypothetical protein